MKKRIQVLISVMHQQDHQILRKMNINSDVIVVNQCDRNEIEEFEYKNHNIKFLSFSERGVGLSRNNALMRADAEFCIFADCDVVYNDGYEQKIIKAFDENPKADVLMFGFENNSNKKAKKKKINFFNSLKYGAVNIVIRLKSIREKNINFSLLFGGGAKYSAGEDSLFIFNCLQSGLNIYHSGVTIGAIVDDEAVPSTWFKGYTEKYFYDKGVLYGALSKSFRHLLCLQFALRRNKMFKKDMDPKKALKLMINGSNDFVKGRCE